MDYEGKSILEQTTDPSTPAILAAIVVLQAEVKALDESVASVQSSVNSLSSTVGTAVTDVNTLRQRVNDDEKTVAGLTLAVNTTKADVKTLEQDVSRIQQDITAMAAQIRVLQNAPNITDCGSLVLFCPVSTDTATQRSSISSDWDSFYSTGYSPPGSPFTLTPFLAVNFQAAANPFGVYWNRPTAATGAFASFEIDATVSFIPSIDMAVRVSAKVMPDLFSTTPMFVFGYNEARYTPSAFVSTWSARVIVQVPLTNATQTATFIIFEVESRTVTGDSQQFIYGIGESFDNQHHLIVKRIQ